MSAVRGRTPWQVAVQRINWRRILDYGHATGLGLSVLVLRQGVLSPSVFLCVRCVLAASLKRLRHVQPL